MLFLASIALLGLSGVFASPCKPHRHPVDEVVTTTVTEYDHLGHPHPKTLTLTKTQIWHTQATISSSKTSPIVFPWGPKKTTVTTATDPAHWATWKTTTTTTTTEDPAHWGTWVTSSVSSGKPTSSTSTFPCFGPGCQKDTTSSKTTSPKSTTTSSTKTTSTLTTTPAPLYTSSTTSQSPAPATTSVGSGAIGNAVCDNTLSAHTFYLQAVDTSASLNGKWGVLTEVGGLKKMTFVTDKSAGGIWQFVPNVCNLASSGTVSERLVMNRPAEADVEPQFNIISQVFASGHNAPECNWQDKTNLVCSDESFYVCSNGLLGLGPVPVGCDELSMKVVLV